MQILEKIVISRTEPDSTNVLWIKPIKGGVCFYAFYMGTWNTLKIMNDKGTPSTEDDEIVDISNIPEIVEKEVTEQITAHDKSVNDTHNAVSADTNDYPDVTVIQASI